MNPFEMVVIIVAIITVGRIITTRRGGRLGRGLDAGFGHRRGVEPPEDHEQKRLREELQDLKQRVAVLERIVTDRGLELADEIEKLRDTRVS